MRIRAYKLVAFASFIIFGNATLATDIYDGKGLAIDEFQDSHFPGESIQLSSLYNNHISTDISIPGPNGLDLTIQRTYFMGLFSSGMNVRNSNNTQIGLAWKISFPTITLYDDGSNIQDENFSCMGNADNVVASLGGNSSSLKSLGYAASSQMLSGAVIAFKGGPLLKCESNLPLIYNPDGKKISFYDENALRSSLGLNSISTLGKYTIKSESDRFGNSINYFYRALGGHLLLDYITRTDGARVDFVYTTKSNGDVLLDKMTYGSRQVRYIYESQSSGTGFTYYRLKEFANEENLSTTYTYGQYLQSITQPGGLRVDYTYEIQQSSLPRVENKTLSGPDIISRTISYSSSGDFGSPSDVITTVTETDFIGTQDKVTTYKFDTTGDSSSDFSTGKVSLEGTLISIVLKIGSHTAYKLENEWAYRNLGTIGCKRNVNLRYEYRNVDFKDCGSALKTKRTETYYSEHDSGSDSFVTEYSDHDTYGNPETVKRFDRTGYYLIETDQTYHNDLVNWVIGLPSITNISKQTIVTSNPSWIEKEKYTYYSSSHSSKSLPSSHYIFGRKISDFTYQSTGDLLRETIGQSYKEYSNYKRGVPQTIKERKRYTSGEDTLTRQVDYYGNITYETDYRGNALSKTYDDLNRITKIDFSNSSWSDTNFTYDDANNLTTETTGDYRTVTSLDANGNIVLVSEEDVSVLGSKRYQKMEYNKQGLASFISFPSSSSNPSNGQHFEYDVISRKTEESTDEVNTTTIWEYKSGHKVSRSGGERHDLTTSYQSYGELEYKTPIKVGDISIGYNVAEKISTVSPSGSISRQYYYNQYQDLCRTFFKESGHTYFGYNSIGKVSWEAYTDGSNFSGCGTAPTNKDIYYSYDNREELKYVANDSNTSVDNMTYDSDGNLLSRDAPGVDFTYTYDDRSNLLSETMLIDGSQISISYSYNSLGHLQTIIYPNNEAIQLSPNALGQPTKVGTYATNASYHPTDRLESFTYGNGIEKQISIIGGGVVSEISDKLGSITRQRKTYSYNSRLNLTSAIDHVNSSNSLTSMAYDSRHRLISGSSGSNSFSMSYDSLDNFSAMTFGSRTINYSYDSENLLDTISGSDSRSFIYDSRGSVTDNGKRTFAYDSLGRMTSSCNTLFVYDGRDLRAKKEISGQSEYFFYDKESKLRYKKGFDGTQTKYYYLGDELIAKHSWGGSGSASPVDADCSSQSGTQPTLIEQTGSYGNYLKPGCNWQVTSSNPWTTTSKLYCSAEEAATKYQFPNGCSVSAATGYTVTGNCWNREIYKD